MGTRVSFSNCTGCSSMHSTGTLRIVRLFVGFQHFFHVRDKLRVRFRRNHPVFDLRFVMPFFLACWRTVSWLMDSTISNATSSAANSRSVHRHTLRAASQPHRDQFRFPLAIEHRLAGRGVPVFASTPLSKPSITRRSRSFSTVRNRAESASAICSVATRGRPHPP